MYPDDVTQREASRMKVGDVEVVTNVGARALVNHTFANSLVGDTPS